MNELTPFNRQTQQKEYCSQPRIIYAPTQTSKAGLETIQKIMSKEVLCRHDVEKINHVYQTIDLLEKRMDWLPEHTSHQALETILNKIKAIVQQNTTTPQSLICLYQLRRFSDKDLQIDNLFESVSQKFKKTPQNTQTLAEHLPYCISKDQFDEDVTDLIGSTSGEQVQKILNQKRGKLQKDAELKIAIAKKKSRLEELRKADPHNYPPYLNELLDSGSIHLYDHLLQMRQLNGRNERRAEVEKIPFSTLSHIVLETREAIIQKVENSLPDTGKHFFLYPHILFLVGGSGAGKSTTLCFLRGDSMVLKDFHYESQSDTDKIIGHAGAISCTFLPTVEVVNGLVIVDFPGFDDSNGPLISLGMEFALKALIKRYHPKILVMEAITNTEGRFAAAARLGSRLRRLLKNKKDCFLGITKYSKDPDFIQIKTMENQQKNDRLAPRGEEISLEAEINQASKTLAGLPPIPELKTYIEKMQQDLAEKQQKLNRVRQKRAQQRQMPLPDTDIKKESRSRVQERENELLKQIGVGEIIRFDNLEDPLHLSSCLKRFAKPGEGLLVNSQQNLDPDDEKLVDHRFENNLKQEMENQKGDYVSFNNFKAFAQSVLSSSLINTTFSSENPEIGQFLHLPENDPRLVSKYDKAVVGSCIKNYIESIIKEINISFINKVLEETKIKSSKLDTLNQKTKKLRDYVMGLLGSLPEDPQKAEEQWSRIQQEHQAAAAVLENSFKLPTWATVLLCIPIGVPYAIRALYKWKEQNKAAQEAFEKVIDQCLTEVEQIYNTLVRLKDLEKIIEKQEQIDAAFHSVQISLKSEAEFNQSIQDKINKVRSIYGAEDWDKRASILRDKLKELYFFGSASIDFRELISLLDENLTCSNSGLSLIKQVSAEDKLLYIKERKIFVYYKHDSKRMEEILKESRVGLLRPTLLQVFSPETDINIDAFANHVEIDIKKPLFRVMLYATLFSFIEKHFD